MCCENFNRYQSIDVEIKTRWASPNVNALKDYYYKKSM